MLIGGSRARRAPVPANFTTAPRRLGHAIERGVVVGTAIAAPLLLGVAMGQVGTGVLVCLGGYLVAFVDQRGPTRTRAVVLPIAAAVHATVYLASRLAANCLLVSLALLGVLVFYAIGTGRDARLRGRLGAMPTTAFLIAAEHTPHGHVSTLPAALLLLVGGLWYAAVAVTLLDPVPDRPAASAAPSAGRRRYVVRTLVIACALFAAVSSVPHGVWAVIAFFGSRGPVWRAPRGGPG
uniref:hypothetical protein n=1 Tax=Nocardia tenerifensis TaxID=228006 RepID=UPI0005943C83